MKYKVISLFSGCGGLDLGFIGGFAFRDKHYGKTAFKLISSVDFDVDAVTVFNANNKYFAKHKSECRDVMEIASDEIPACDILLAGFPCQPFSNAGNREGINDKYGRGTLFYECERFIETIKKASKNKRPLAFVFENVRGILSSKLPDGLTVPEEIVKRMREHGYETRYKLLKASDFGVPQNRYRVIMVGVRNDMPPFEFELFDDIVKKYDIASAKNGHYELLLGSLLCDIPKNTAHRDDVWDYSPSGQKMIEMIGACADGKNVLKKFSKKIPLDKISDTVTTGRSWKNIPVEDMPPRFKKIYMNPKKYRSPNFYRRFALGEICGTITASGQPENSGITHPFEHRRFSVREIARIQSFPDDFVFPVKSVPNAYKVVGNAVPPVLAWVLAKGLEKHLNKHHNGD